MANLLPVHQRWRDELKRARVSTNFAPLVPQNCAVCAAPIDVKLWFTDEVHFRDDDAMPVHRRCCVRCKSEDHEVDE